ISAQGQDLFGKLEGLSVPTLAVIHGPCLGGGLELALACDYRVALDQPRTQLGLPEIELGLVPGWGGTQRLPRVIGMEPALKIILRGRRVGAREALSWGLVDALGRTQQELLDSINQQAARALKEGKRPKRKLPLRSWRQRLLESTPVARRFLLRGIERLLR